MYDVAPLYHEKSITSNGACRLCGVVPPDRDAHAQLHLSTAEATVQYDYGRSPAVVRVVPANTVPAPKADTCSVIVDTRNEANARHLRDAHMKARELNRALKRKLNAARRSVHHSPRCRCEDCRHPGWARDVAILGGDPSL